MEIRHNMADLQNQFNIDPVRFLLDAPLIFWDFDGVIKDSLEVKALAFEKLFLPFGNEISLRIRQHHECNWGISRYEKIPLYLSWVGEVVSQERVEEYCEAFSRLVFQEVIDSPWVPGVVEYIEQNYGRQYFVLVTATPQQEIESILDKLKLREYFREVYGSPIDKKDALNMVLYRLRYDSSKALMIGDAEVDLKAAQTNSVPFLLRRTIHNLPIQTTFTGLIFDNFNYE